MRDSSRDKQRRMLQTFKHEITGYRASKELPPGRIRLLEFCLEAEVNAKLGKRFLTKKAEEFSGVVDVDQFGDIVYFFGDAKGKFLEEIEETNGNLLEEK